MEGELRRPAGGLASVRFAGGATGGASLMRIVMGAGALSGLSQKEDARPAAGTRT